MYKYKYIPERYQYNTAIPLHNSIPPTPNTHAHTHYETRCILSLSLPCKPHMYTRTHVHTYTLVAMCVQGIRCTVCATVLVPRVVCCRLPVMPSAAGDSLLPVQLSPVTSIPVVTLHVVPEFFLIALRLHTQH